MFNRHQGMEIPMFKQKNLIISQENWSKVKKH